MDTLDDRKTTETAWLYTDLCLPSNSIFTLHNRNTSSYTRISQSVCTHHDFPLLETIPSLILEHEKANRLLKYELKPIAPLCARTLFLSGLGLRALAALRVLQISTENVNTEEARRMINAESEKTMTYSSVLEHELPAHLQSLYLLCRVLTILIAHLLGLLVLGVWFRDGLLCASSSVGSDHRQRASRAHRSARHGGRR